MFDPKVEPFRVWKFKVESYLDSLGLEGELSSDGTLVSTTTTSTSEVKDEKDKDKPVKVELVNKNNKKVRVFLQFSIEVKILELLSIDHSTTASQLWRQICEYYERDNTTSSRINLKSQLYNDRLKSNEKVIDYTSRITKVAEQLRLMNQTISDEDLLVHLFQGVSANYRYETIITVLKQKDDLTFNKACRALEDHEVQLNMKSMTKGESVNYVNKEPKHKFNNEKFQSNGKYCNWCKKKGHKYDECNIRLKRCHKCHKTGHFAKDCKERMVSNQWWSTSRMA